MHLVGLALHTGLQGAEPLVGEHEAAQVRRVGVRGLQDGPKLLSEAAQTQRGPMSAEPAIQRAFTYCACKTKPGKLLWANAHSTPGL